MVKIEVKCAQLNDNNYGTWAPRVTMLLTLEKCMRMVTEGLGAEPTPEDIEMDENAKAVIGAYLSDSLLPTFKAAPSAKALWDTLAATFSRQNHTRRLTLRRELTSMKKQQSETMSMYFARAQQLREDLQGADQDIGEDEVVCAVLSGLPRQYDVAVAIMEQADSALTMDDCLSKLLVVEHKLGKDSDEPSAFFSKADFRQSGGGSGSRGGFRSGSSNSYQDNRICWKCGKAGHLRRDCKQYQEQHTTSASVSFAAHVASAVSISAEATADWLLDTGASCHMTPDKAMFANYRATDQLTPGNLPTVRIADGNKAAVAGIGDVILVTRVEGQLRTRRLLNVMHVPDLQQNLFSVTALTRDGDRQLYLDMTGDNCEIMVYRPDGSKFCFAEADLSDGLFWIRGSDPEAYGRSPAAEAVVPCAVAASSTASVPEEAVGFPCSWTLCGFCFHCQ
jgi:hypothetical protein